MAAIEGLDLSIVGSDTNITAGMIDGVHVDAGTVDAAADADGDYLVVWTGSAFDHVASADQTAAMTVLGTATVASALVTAVEYTNRGRDPLASS